MLGGLLLGPVILGLTSLVHEPGGLPGNLPPQFRWIHLEALNKAAQVSVLHANSQPVSA
jgi:hypothetical protein